MNAKNRFGEDILVSLNRALTQGEEINGVYINDQMTFEGIQPINCSFNLGPSMPTQFMIGGWIYPYSILNFKNIDYCIYNKFKEPDSFQGVFTDKIPVIFTGNRCRMVGEKSWYLNTAYIEWVDLNSISINIGGEIMMLF